MNGLVSAFVNLWIYKFGRWQLTDFVSLRAYKFLSFISFQTPYRL